MIENDKPGRVLNIGFISTRFRGLDGVSLEAEKWASILKEFRHNCYWFAGQLDRGPQVSMLVPEAFFGHPATESLTRTLFSTTRRSRLLTNALHAQKEFLKDRLYEFLDRFDIDLIVPENVLSIPMHLPLGMAITELIAETGIPTIAHHHDFFWERTRFLTNACPEILNMAFPPELPSIKHVVISTVAQRELAARRSIAASVIYNVMDFDRNPPRRASSGQQFRREMGFGKDDLIVLQPTRVVHRKGIEQAIYLVEALNIPDTRLIISHAAGDEGPAYAAWVEKWASRQKVPLYFIHDRLQEESGQTNRGRLFSLQDVYPHADLVTYPSLYEGFGNAFLEAVYFRKPILVNRYSVYVVDIEPKGFEVVSIDGFLTDAAVAQVADLLRDPEKRKRMGEKNYQIARKYFSFQILRKELANIISSFFGIAPPRGLIERIFRWS
jgi:glycosyltransferase involved in cell wall biosynthesis